MSLILSILAVVSALILLIFTVVEVSQKIKEKYAIQVAKSFCKTHGLSFESVSALPSAYALYFIKNGKQYYATFAYENGKINWKDGDPLNKIARKETVRSLKVSNKNKLRLAGSVSF